MVLLGRIELPTSPLPRVRSTTELQQRWEARRALLSRPPSVSRNLSLQANNGKTLPMAEGKPGLSREERLAAKLRENLRRRKEQARAKRPDDTLPKPQEDG
jgi:hypothetical protein